MFCLNERWMLSDMLMAHSGAAAISLLPTWLPESG
jgi:hypothetical protein